MSYTVVKYNDLVSNDYSLLANDYSYLEEYKTIENLKNKFDNIFTYFDSIDGFAFPSKNYMPEYIPIYRKIPLIQIGNVNSEVCLSQNQNFEFLPVKEEQEKKKFLLSNKGVLISLTGGDDINNNISTFFDNDFKCFLNQRVSFFKLKNDNNMDLLYYFYAFTKHKIFNIQWIGSGSIQKNTVSKERKKIFIPKISNETVIKYISVLTQAIINKDKLIKDRHKRIIETIEKELQSNQKKDTFAYKLPKYQEVRESGRLDTNLYRKEFKEIDFLIKNYSKGFNTIYDLGFALSRGQNLQVSNIGNSIYSKTYYPNFYTLMLPKFLSKYGTIDTVEYIGNQKELKTLKKGDLIFGAEGFEKGRSIVIIEEKERTITNIHGITIQQEEHNVEKAIFVKCCLDYLRDKGLIDLFAVGGNGGSLAQKYWEYIPFPKFAENEQLNLVKLYHNKETKYESETWSLDNFLTNDNEFNNVAGIYELDKTAKQLKAKLNLAIDNIVNDKPVKINFA